VAIHKTKLWAIFYDGSEVEVVATSFDARRVGEPTVTRVPATAFSASTVGQNFKCLVQASGQHRSFFLLQNIFIENIFGLPLI
jgi:hypothetical protein